MSEVQKNIQIADSGLIKLTDSGEAYRFAKAVIASRLAPDSFKTPEAVMVAWQQGAELGLKPMQSLQHIAVINGRPTIYGKAATGIVINSGLVEIFEEWFENEKTDLTACCKIKRRGIDSIKVAKFSFSDAKKAGLVARKGEMYIKYPKDMLMYKARARAFGALFGDVLCGLPIYEDYKEIDRKESSHNHSTTEQAPILDPILDAIEVDSEEAKEPEDEPTPEPDTIGEARAKKLSQLAAKKFPGTGGSSWLKKKCEEYEVEKTADFTEDQALAIEENLNEMEDI